MAKKKKVQIYCLICKDKFTSDDYEVEYKGERNIPFAVKTHKKCGTRCMRVLSREDVKKEKKS